MSAQPSPHQRLLAVLLATSPQSEGDGDDFAAVQSALDFAIARGEDTALFLMSEGVRYAHDPRLQPLLRAGVDVTLCAMDAEAHGLDTAAIAALGIELGSQHDHARLVRDADRFLAWT